ncbi:MAG: hypothetical protein OHK0023_19270 [Anaerolineae bacterium]
MNLLTVTGSLPVETIRLMDGHTHAWIMPPDGIAPEARLDLHDAEAIRAELHDFRAAGGSALVDCQPYGCGRDANMLRKLSQETDVAITATTGFHQRKYYPPNHWLWSATEDAAADFFIGELTVGMRETLGAETPQRATTIKVGYEGTIEGQTRRLMIAAARASAQTGAVILFHTEQGKNIEGLLPFFADLGIRAERLYLCHVDKRPDVGLHRELAQAGVLLGYDTFARPKYAPDQGVWPLLRAMVAADLEGAIAIGLDLALPSMWQHFGGQPGMTFLPDQIVPRLQQEGFKAETILRLTGQNVAQRLVRVTANA